MRGFGFHFFGFACPSLLSPWKMIPPRFLFRRCTVFHVFSFPPLAGRRFTFPTGVVSFCPPLATFFPSVFGPSRALFGRVFSSPLPFPLLTNPLPGNGRADQDSCKSPVRAVCSAVSPHPFFGRELFRWCLCFFFFPAPPRKRENRGKHWSRLFPQRVGRFANLDCHLATFPFLTSDDVVSPDLVAHFLGQRADPLAALTKGFPPFFARPSPTLHLCRCKLVSFEQVPVEVF